MTATKTKKNIEIDLNIFKEDININKCDVNNSDPIRGCNSLNRLLCSMKYYSMLNITKNKDDKDLFNQFMVEIYGSSVFLDDFNHLIDIHSHKLEEINEWIVNSSYFGVCDVKTCLFTTRHYEFSDVSNVLDPITNFFKWSMDSLHFYVYHLYDTGMRIKKVIKSGDDDDEIKGDDDDDTYFDKEFWRIVTAINSRQHMIAEAVFMDMHDSNF